MRIPDVGRGGSGMQAAPVTVGPVDPGGAGPRLEYQMNLTTAGTVTVLAYLSPRNAALPDVAGMRYAVSIDARHPHRSAPSRGEIHRGRGGLAAMVKFGRVPTKIPTITITERHIGRAMR